MRQTTGTRKSPSEKLVKDIKRATRKQYSSEGCCQTNDCKHQIDGAIQIYALNS